MRRRRRCSYLAVAIVALAAASALLVAALSFEVSYFMGFQIRRVDRAASIETHSCEATHIALVVGGFETTTRTITLLKSILRHHPHPLTFHFVIDADARRVLPLLFDTWRIPDVSVHFYDLSLYASRVDWIPNRHYSQRYGLVKLVLADILPADVHRVVLLDSDVLPLAPLSSLLEHWNRMNSTQMYGLAENLSGWYTTADPTRRTWPAIGRGFNSGVALVSLASMRAGNWSGLWREEAYRQLQSLGHTMLADQDIVNAVIRAHPRLVYRLPCVFNLQMGINSQPELCDAPISHIKIVHWNSPLKTRTSNRLAVFFKRHFKMFEQMDGSALAAARQTRCGKEQDSSFLDVYEYDENGDGCGEFLHAGNTRYRTQTFVVPYKNENKSPDVALVSQMSLDRLPLFEKLAHSWPGPLSISVYVSDAELSQLIDFWHQSALAARSNIALHAVFKTGDFYPINYLRNTALRNADAGHVYLADIDFLPSENLYTSLLSLLSARNTTHTALIVPAFEFTHMKATPLPADKADLMARMDDGSIQIFRQDVWLKGHQATDYDRWRSVNTTYEVTWQPDYEPYIVLARNETPLYDERFVGFGWNKVTHIMTLNAKRFTFSVLPAVFTVHQPHPASFEITKFRGSHVYRKCMKRLKGEFVRDLLTNKL